MNPLAPRKVAHVATSAHRNEWNLGEESLAPFAALTLATLNPASLGETNLCQGAAPGAKVPLREPENGHRQRHIRRWRIPSKWLAEVRWQAKVSDAQHPLEPPFLDYVFIGIDSPCAAGLTFKPVIKAGRHY